jgi:hypothetical protein
MRRGVLVLAVPALLLGGCDDGQGPSTGLTEPMIVSNGQFIPGDLPGTPPPADAAAPSPDGATPPLTVVSTSADNTTLIPPGAYGQILSGAVSGDTSAVGLRLDGLGSGYWVVNLGTPDPTVPTFPFKATVGFEPTIPPGNRNVLFAALGPGGAGGVQNYVTLCFEPRIPDNGHACRPTNALPAAVLSLQWDSNFDLDLHVVTPNGDDISPKMVYGMLVDAGGNTKVDPNIPHIDRDALGSCVANGIRQEDVIFMQPLPRGTTTIYVDPFASCGQAAARFNFTIWERSGTCATCQMVQVGSAVAGEVLASQVTGGLSAPLKIDTIPVN